MSSLRETRTSGSATPWLTILSPRWKGKRGFWNVLTCYQCSPITQSLGDKANWCFVESRTIIFYPLSGWFHWIRDSKLTYSRGKLNPSIYTRNKQKTNKPENRKSQEVWSPGRISRISFAGYPYPVILYSALISSVCLASSYPEVCCILMMQLSHASSPLRRMESDISWKALSSTHMHQCPLVVSAPWSVVARISEREIETPWKYLIQLK